MKVTPSPVKIYFDGMIAVIKAHPIVISADTIKERMGKDTGFIQMRLKLIKKYVLALFEFFKVGSGVLKYRYQLLDSASKPVLRWDNAPHHPGMSTFPHHQHDGSAVVPSQQPSVDEILVKIKKKIG